MAALLTAIGADRDLPARPGDAFRQGIWIVVARRRLRRDALPAAPRLPAARELQVPLRARRDRAARSCRRCRCSGTTVNGARLWVHVGALQFQPGELAKIVLIVFLAGYLREKREVLAQGRLKDFGPLLVIWGGAMLVLVETNDLGCGAPLLRDLPRRCSTSRRRALSYVAVGRGALPRRRGRRLPRRRPRARPRDDLAAPVDRPQGLLPAQRQAAPRQDCASYQLVKSLYSIGHGGSAAPASARARSRRPRRHAADPVPEHGLHLLGARAGARADRRRGAAARLHALRRCAASGSRCSPRTASRSCSRPG